LWRYLIGDTTFHVIKSVPHSVTGRTKHHINFGEELMVENDRSLPKRVTNPNGSGRLHRGSIFMEGKVRSMKGDVIEFSNLP
jgi:hypothetical protein